MPDGAPVLLLALELENDGLLAAAMGHDGALNQRAARVGSSFDGIAIDYREHAAEFDFRAGVAQQRFHFNCFARGDAILLPACFDDCVHNGPLRLPLSVLNCARSRRLGAARGRTYTL